MCGLAGFWLINPEHEAWCMDAVQRMVSALRSRGPDDQGQWLETSCGLALGHRRLSIQDLSPAGHQPMVSASGRYVIVYNGELYGFDRQRKELREQGWDPKGHSDTELLLQLIERHGVQTAVSQVNGMFAFAVWDRNCRQLTLVRDRLGIKPLYYGWRSQGFLFGSELKALRCFPGFESRRDAQAIAEFLKVGYIPAPLSIEQSIYKLLPGHWVTISQPDVIDTPPQAYWNLIENAWRPGQENPLDGPNAVDVLDRQMREVVQQHMISDVPLGAFLSGGIDSSLVVAMMKQVSQQTIKTFAIGFDVREYNEADYAQVVAQHLGTEHHQWIVTARDAQAVIPQLPEIYDEPFADSSQIPTYLVSQFARQHVTVALSGDGGDECYGGYRRYPYFHHLWKRLTRLPGPLRRMLGAVLQAASPGLPSRYRESVRWRSRLLGIRKFEQCYEQINRHWKFPADLMTDDWNRQAQVSPTAVSPEGLLPEDWQAELDLQQWDDQAQWMMVHDTLRYLPDDILTKVDRASMACSLEARVPLLDHRLVETSWRFASAWKQGTEPRDDQQNGKVILQELLARYLPRSCFQRPKVGFGVPLDVWLRTDLRDWAEALLDPRQLQQEGIFQVEPLRQVWDAHVQGRSDQQYLLWDVLMFRAWGELT